MQSFWKDVLLFVLILFLLVNHRKIRPVASSRIAAGILIIATLLVTTLQWYVLKHLPIVDCLPYKKGNDLLEQMKTPAGATADEYSYTFRYKKDGKLLEYPEDDLPENLDDSYVFLERGQKLVRKGNGLKAKITDFNLVTQSGNDTTMAILSSPGKYVLLFMLTKPAGEHNDRIDEKLWDDLSKRVPFYIVTADPEVVKIYSKRNTVLTCDGTVIKTAARANPTYFVMQGAKVLGKYSYADANKVREMLK
jgi:hypothetical protein